MLGIAGLLKQVLSVKYFCNSNISKIQGSFNSKYITYIKDTTFSICKTFDTLGSIFH